MTIEELKIEHDLLNEGVAPGFIRLPGGVEIPTVEESRFGFEFFCWRSPEMVAEMKAFLQVARGKRRFFDIGALHGVFSLAFKSLNPKGFVYAFEPHPGSYRVLCSNSELAHDMHCIDQAVSDHYGMIEMGQEWDCHYSTANKEGEIYKIPCVTGDSYVRMLGADLIKIDVEGHEAHVLRGLSETIANFRPAILLEIHPLRLASCEEHVGIMLEQLYEEGYTPTDTATGQELDWDTQVWNKQDCRILFTP